MSRVSFLHRGKRAQGDAGCGVPGMPRGLQAAASANAVEDEYQKEEEQQQEE